MRFRVWRNGCGQALCGEKTAGRRIMITHKHITGIVCMLTAAAVLACFLALGYAGKLTEAAGGKAVSLQYEELIFGAEDVIRIDIRMDEADWEDMLANAMEEKYRSCDVTINGQEIRNVGIRPKGNTSLSAIAMDPETDRYSLKLEFDHYVEGQTCYGLDKLVLNNNYADATNMKEAVVYDMYRYLGADASLYQYAEIWVNGEYWGVYLALEAVEDSFLLRNYGAERGVLYKPEGVGGPDGGGMPGMGPGMEGSGPGETREWPEMEGGGPEGNGEPQMPPEEAGGRLDAGTGGWPGAGSGGWPGENGEWPKMEGGWPGENGEWPERKGGVPGGGFSGNGGGANLEYTDDDLESYADLWEGQVTDGSETDQRRTVAALKAGKEGADPESYLDVDNLLKYMAVHTFSVNLDSLSGNMAHNYYLYEYQGKLNILPWDYNLAFGGMNAGPATDASEMINDAIDTPFQGTDFFDVLLENEEYRSRYHEYLRVLAEEYVLEGKFEETYRRIRNRIDELVAKDPTAFYPYEEYDAGAKMLYRTMLLRAESVRGQLEGTIPATDEGQRADPAGLIDASGIDLAVMGTFSMSR